MTLHHHLASSEPQAGGRILVVDADETTRALYRDSLIVVGCDVVEASDGRDALTKALVRRPTLVITEIELPLVDGYALCEILRRDRMTADVPILVVMADGRPANVERARRAGADTVFVKPTSIEKILDETRRLVADSKYARGGDIAPARDTPARSGEPTTRVRLPVRTRTVRTKVFSRFTTTTPPHCCVRAAIARSRMSAVTLAESATDIPNNGTTSSVPRRAVRFNTGTGRGSSALLAIHSRTTFRRPTTRCDRG